LASRVLTDLDHALDVANKESFAGLPGGVKAENLALMSRIRVKAEALDASVLTAFEATGEHRVEGHSSAIGWLKHHGHEGGRGASRRRRLARQLKAMPLAEAAMVRGELTSDHVAVLALAQHRVGESDFALAEEPLVDAATELRYGDFVRTVDYFVMRARPDDALARERDAFEQRGASSSPTLDGTGRVDADLDSLGYPIWQAELDRLMDHLYEQDWSEARDRLGRRPLPSELARTARQRRLDAMVLMAQRSAAYQGDPGPSRFQLVVHADTDTVAQLMAVLVEALADDDPDADLDLESTELGPDSLHELDDGTVVTVNTLLLALLTGTIRGILYDPVGEILRFGRDKRIFTPAQVQALQAKYRRCCHPYGCDRTGPRTQTDHTHEHEDGGPTDIANGNRRCGPDNRWKHNTKGQPPPDTGTPPDTNQRRLPPRVGAAP
jgi:hypothetical protein